MITLEGSRARRVISRAMPRVMGRFPSSKSNRSVHWESQLERDFLIHLEFDPDVLGFREQPVTVDLTIAGRRRRYTPDLYVERRAGRWIYEVKPADKVAAADVAPVLEAAAAHFMKSGFNYSVVTEHEIRRQPYLHNIHLLLRYRDVIVSQGAKDTAVALLSATQELTLAELAEKLADHGGATAVFAMVLSNHLPFDLTAVRLSPSAVVSLS